MRVCLLCYRGNPFCGGQGVYLYSLSRALAGRGHEVTILVGPPYPHPTPWARVERIPNHQYWGKRRHFLPNGNPLGILRPLEFLEFSSSRLGYFPEPLAFSLRAWRRFSMLHRETPYDIVHDVETLGYGLLGIRWQGVPVVSTVHHPLTLDLISHLGKARSWKERYYNVVFFPLIMQGIVARRIEGIITSSEAGIMEIERAFRVRRESIHLVHTGVDLEVFSPNPSVEKVPGRVLFVGNAQDPRKGIRLLLEALRLLPDGVTLVIVDEREPKKPYAPAMVRQMGLGERVVFTGRVTQEELVDHYRRANVLVLPSFFEGFGLPVVEALGCGTPVVVTDAGSLPEVVGEGEGGFIVPTGDSRALASAIERITRDPSLAREMGSKGRKRMERLFSWDRTASHTEKVYEIAAERCRAKGKEEG